MTADRWERLKAIFHGALALPPGERRAWLARACDGDRALLQEAETLLQSIETADGFLEAPLQIDPADLETLPPGAVLGAYRIVSAIGRGGMGVVYLAEDVRLGRRVALKALPPAVADNAELRQRLRREARAAATISHPAVATVYALEEIDGHLVIVSEYVEGETLRDCLARGPLAPARVRVIARQIAQALCAAHEAGVVHRDLKPENVLVTASGALKVVDFGIAHVEGPEATRLTRAGAMLGTPAYMAPEQLVGGPVDARADLYAFGVLLSELLTGRHPLQSSGSPGAVPGTLQAVILRCLQPEAAARFASAHELLRALDDEAAPADAAERAATGRPRWWWEFHQAAAAVVYGVMLAPAWRAREAIGGAWGRTLFIVTLAAVVAAATLRLHLWFTSRFYPSELRWARRRSGRWIRAADWTFVAALAAGGLVIGDEPLAGLLISVAIGVALAFLVIERVTTRAAFRSSSTER